MKRLELEGLVESVPHRGTFVSTLEVQDIIEIYEIREPLESAAVRAAAERMSDETARALQVEVADVLRSISHGDFSKVKEQDVHLHKEIVSASSNNRLAQILTTLDDQVHRIRALALSNPDRISASTEEHRAIVEAIANRDPVGAERAMQVHLQAARINAINIALVGKRIDGSRSPSARGPAAALEAPVVNGVVNG